LREIRRRCSAGPSTFLLLRCAFRFIRGVVRFLRLRTCGSLRGGNHDLRYAKLRLGHIELRFGWRCKSPIRPGSVMVIFATTSRFSNFWMESCRRKSRFKSSTENAALLQLPLKLIFRIRAFSAP